MILCSETTNRFFLFGNECFFSVHILSISSEMIVFFSLSFNPSFYSSLFFSSFPFFPSHVFMYYFCLPPLLLPHLPQPRANMYLPKDCCFPHPPPQPSDTTFPLATTLASPFFPRSLPFYLSIHLSHDPLQGEGTDA